jgi:hypothetical protein
VYAYGGGFGGYFFYLGVDCLAIAQGDLGGLAGVDLSGGWEVGLGGVVIQFQVGGGFVLWDGRGEEPPGPEGE